MGGQYLAGLSLPLPNCKLMWIPGWSVRQDGIRVLSVPPWYLFTLKELQINVETQTNIQYDGRSMASAK